MNGDRFAIEVNWSGSLAAEEVLAVLESEQSMHPSR